MEEYSGYTCNRCGKVFETKEEFIKQHKEEIKNEIKNEIRD